MTVPSQQFCAQLGLRVPLVQAPMAGVSTPSLAAAVSNAGGLGSLAVGAVSAEATAALIHEVRAQTSAPFNVNVFAHQPEHRDPEHEQQWLAFLAPYFAEFGAPVPEHLTTPYRTIGEDPEKQEVLLRARLPVVSFHFGLPDRAFLQALQQEGSLVLACVTTVAEAQQAEALGVDLLVAQGAEAGGHRGHFSADQDEQIGTLALVPQVAQAVRIPVIAAGGIANGRSLAAALILGAAGAQVGTAFIACPESSASAAHREALRSPAAQHTALTRAFSGRSARGLVNRFVQEAQAGPLPPGYPEAYSVGKALAAAAAQQGDFAFSAFWAGQAAALSGPAEPAAAVVARFLQEAEAALRDAPALLSPSLS